VDNSAFPGCMFGVVTALRRLNIDPHAVVIELPREAWLKLANQLSAHYAGMIARGSGSLTWGDSFTYQGIKFIQRDDSW